MNLTPAFAETPTTATSASSSTVPVDRPAGALTGDWVVVAVRNQLSSNTTEPSITGFVSAGPAWNAGTVGSFRRVRFLIKRIDDINTEAASYTVSVPGGGRTAVAAFLIRGARDTSPVQDTNDIYGGTKFVGGVTVEPMEADHLPGLALTLFAGDFGPGPDHVPTALPAGWDQVAEVVAYAGGGSDTTVARTYLWVGVQEMASSPTGEASITWPTDQTNYAAEGIVLRGGLAGVAVAVSSGGTPAHMTIWDGTKERAPVSAVPLRPGFPTVASMLATPGATMAHRGGSAVYPEMSEFAYDRAALRGYGMLEFSCQRSSDGVWFGMHDPSFDRTSEVTGSLNASDMTWAQIQGTYQNSLNSNGTPRPYWRLIDFIAKWGQTHVLMIDPKNSTGQSALRTEFLDLLDAHTDPTHTIVKVFAGDSNPWSIMANMATARGYETWGYFYEDDYLDGDVDALEGNYSLLGMSIAAAETTWTGMATYGKPLVGHVANSQADYDLAITRGADIVQCSNPALITPVTYSP